MLPPALFGGQFAQHIETIKTVYLVDDDFRTLCNDYATSRMNLEKIRGKSFSDRRAELDYQQLSYELEKEILEYIKNIS